MKDTEQYVKRIQIIAAEDGCVLSYDDALDVLLRLSELIKVTHDN